MTTVFTIGHSNQSADSFDALLAAHGIELLVDVRSKPYSRFRHFNTERLSQRLVHSNIRYEHLPDLGGHPPEDELYERGRVVYERVAMRQQFKRAIEQVMDLSEQFRLVLMCTEENPTRCHRDPLLARELTERGLDVLHIRKDGSLETANAMVTEPNPQMMLFAGTGEDYTWRSPKRIRPQGRQSQ